MIKIIKKNHYMMTIFMVFILGLLTACSDPEVENRKAFIDYLENTVMRSGNALPQLSDDQKLKLGNYVNDYEVLYNFSVEFNKNIQTSFNPIVEHLAQIKVPQDYIIAQPLINDDLTKVFFLKSEIEKIQKQATSAIENAKHPEDLKAVYDAAFKKIVTDKAIPIITSIDEIVDFTRGVNSLGNYLIVNKDNVNYIEGKPNFKTAEQAEGYNQLINYLATNIQKHEKAIQIYNELNQK